jgi:hypothetical protein
MKDTASSISQFGFSQASLSTKNVVQYTCEIEIALERSTIGYRSCRGGKSSAERGAEQREGVVKGGS